MVLGRALGFSDPEVIRIVKENYIPVVGDDWYQRRRKDAVGTYFRSIVDQTWKAGHWEPGGGDNRQGIYCFTPSGKMLTEMKNVGSQPAELRRLLLGGVDAWNRLSPDARQAATAIETRDIQFDPGYHRPVPAGALVLRQYQRGLKHIAEGGYGVHDFKFHEAPVWAQRDRAWILQEEWKKLVPTNPKPGTAIDLPAAFKRRLLRFHFVEALVGEPGTWAPDQIRLSSFTLTVESATASGIGMKLEGKVLLSTEPDPAKARCGLEGSLVGALNYDAVKGTLDRFDMVLLAECWGALNPHNADSRPGRNPVGFAFELGTGADVDHVPPQGARLLQDYLNP